MAIDLNLHRKTAVRSQDTVEGRSRDKEVHNRERTWLICFCLDRSLGAQMGKPHSIKEECVLNSPTSDRLTTTTTATSSVMRTSGLLVQ